MTVITTHNPDLDLNKTGVPFDGSAHLVLTYDAASNENERPNFNISVVFSPPFKEGAESKTLEFEHGLDLEDIPESWTNDVSVSLSFIRSQLDHMDPAKVITTLFEDIITRHATLNIVDDAEAETYLIELRIAGVATNPWTQFAKGTFPPFF